MSGLRLKFNRWPDLLLLLCIGLTAAVAEELQPQPAVPQTWATAGLNCLTGPEGLREAFWRGSYARLESLFAKPTQERQPCQIALLQTLKREFKQNRYLSFEIENYYPERVLSQDRFEAFMRIVATHEIRSSGAGRSSVHTTHFNGPIVFKMNTDGSALIYESPFFEMLGKRLPAELVGELLLGGVLLLSALTFWGWMLLAAKDFRPKSYSWRWLVALVPVAGGLLFFFFKLLPARLNKAIQ